MIGDCVGCVGLGVESVYVCCCCCVVLVVVVVCDIVGEVFG